MPQLIRQILAVTRNAFTEATRQPIYVVWLMLIGALIVLAPFVSGYTFDDDNAMFASTALSMILVGALLLAAFIASVVIRREIDNGTALTVLTKPIARPLFILGKWAGISAALLLAVWCWAIVFLLMQRHGVMSTARDKFDGPVIVLGGAAVIIAAIGAGLGNYYFNRSFAATFAKLFALVGTLALAGVLILAKGFELQSPTTDLDPQVLIVLLLVAQAVLLVSAAAVMFGTRLGIVATIVLVLMFVMLGLTSDYFIGRHAETSSIIAGIYNFVPNFQVLWMVDPYTEEKFITTGYFLAASAYTAALTVVLLALATALFETRQVS
ncbi:MAG: hypothetical protein AAF743_01495 [Planctomycetota bacterium]